MPLNMKTDEKITLELIFQKQVLPQLMQLDINFTRDLGQVKSAVDKLAL